MRATIPILCAALALACEGRRPPDSPSEVRAVRVAQLPAGPDDAAWRTAPLHTAELVPQDMVEPRLLAPSTPRVSVQAVTDGERIAFRLAWDAPEPSDAPVPSRLPDAVAVQLPTGAGTDLPSPVMGERGRAVEIVLWRASWQATVDGRPDAMEALQPRIKVDHYPFESPSLEKGSADQLAMERRFAPARALGNTMAGPRKQPVEDLVAEGPGTLRRAETQAATGAGKRTQTGWAVVVARPLPADVAAAQRGQVAFAVWQGARGETGGRKMRSGWIPLAVEGAR